MPIISAKTVRAVAGLQPKNLERPAVGLAQALQALNGRGLAGSIWADHAEDLPLQYFEGDPVDGANGSVAFADLNSADDRWHRRDLLHEAGRLGYAAIDLTLPLVLVLVMHQMADKGS